MKRHLLLLLTALLPLVAFAYDIAVENADGKTIYYNYINNGTELEVASSSIYKGVVVIPEEVTYMNRTRKVTRVGEKAFYKCSGLTSITIPNSVTSIGYQAFSGCSSLTSITIPNSVTSIGSSAFGDCSGLTSVTIPNSVTSIGEGAFSGCSSLTSVTIPNSVTSIGSYAFYYCSRLSSITIPNSVTSIGYDAFSGCSGLTSVTIPNSVTSIKGYAFYGCSGLTSVTIPNSVTSIGEYAFSSCDCLTSVTIPNSVTSIGNGAFAYCSGLTSISIPNSVTSIGDYAFRGCSSLTSVTIPNSVTSIGNGAFAYCSGLTSISIPNSVTSIGDYAFRGCSSLTSVTIPNSVTSIGGYAFYYCSSLTSVTIPNSVISIGSYAFGGCNIQEVISMIKNPFYIDTNTFSDNTFYNATLYVPEGTIDTYKTTGGWNKFVFIEEGNGGGDIPPEPSKCATPTISYANGKLTFNCETEDVIFHSTITDTDITSYLTQEVELCVTYTISVYASKPGYEDSEVATGTLCWIDQQPNTEGIVAEDAVTEVKALPVLIQSNGGTITVQGANEGTEIMVYSVNGMKQGSAIATNGFATINTSLQPGSTAIVKIGEKAIKVLIK